MQYGPLDQARFTVSDNLLYRSSLIWMGNDCQLQVFQLLIIPYSTLIDSTPGVFYAWDEFRKQYTHLPTNIAHLTHGRRLADTLCEYCLITDEAEIEVGRPVGRCT
ncbi:hypothetical protein J3R82DRAFT_1151 [Butyriboletus roseoflavus]|nr:hypothetical protein J3R82DRAFT_1151 [Butyriboletus roseoflavus]